MRHVSTDWISSKQTTDFFCSTSLPRTSPRWFDQHFHAFPRSKCRQLTRQRQERILGNAENRTRGCWVRSANATSVLCRPPSRQQISLLKTSLMWNIQPVYNKGDLPAASWSHLAAASRPPYGTPCPWGACRSPGAGCRAGSGARPGHEADHLSPSSRLAQPPQAGRKFWIISFIT